jgi:hypothetical protein
VVLRPLKDREQNYLNEYFAHPHPSVSAGDKKEIIRLLSKPGTVMDRWQIDAAMDGTFRMAVDAIIVG